MAVTLAMVLMVAVGMLKIMGVAVTLAMVLMVVVTKHSIMDLEVTSAMVLMVAVRKLKILGAEVTLAMVIMVALRKSSKLGVAVTLAMVLMVAVRMSKSLGMACANPFTHPPVSSCLSVTLFRWAHTSIRGNVCPSVHLELFQTSNWNYLGRMELNVWAGIKNRF